MGKKQFENLDQLKVPELREVVREVLRGKRVNDEEIKDLAMGLVRRGGWGNTYVGAHLLTEIADIVRKKEFEKVVYQLANDSAWDVRETAAGLLKRLLLLDFDHYFKFMKAMIKDQNPSIRRAAVVGSMQTKLSRKQVEQITQHIYEPLLADNDLYVRKNLGPFALDEMLLRLHPDLAVQFFDEWVKTKSPRTVWNILNAFQLSRLKSGKYGSRLKDAQKYLKMVEDIDNKTVQRAVKSLERRIEKLG